MALNDPNPLFVNALLSAVLFFVCWVEETVDHQEFAQLLGNYGEFVGSVGVVVTLGYLAVQIRQNTRSNRVAAEAESLKQLTNWVGRFSTDQNAQRVWDLNADESKVLSPEDSRQWLWLAGEFCWIAQTAFIQHRRGFLSQEAWSEFERILTGMLQGDLTKQWWLNRETPYSAEFTVYVDRALAGASEWQPKVTSREA
jgi:hypothetical protein